MPSIRFLDFNKDVLLEEVTRMGMLSYGAYSYTDCYNMQFDDYEKLLKIMEVIYKEIRKNAGN